MGDWPWIFVKIHEPPTATGPMGVHFVSMKKMKEEYKVRQPRDGVCFRWGAFSTLPPLPGEVGDLLRPGTRRGSVPRKLREIRGRTAVVMPHRRSMASPRRAGRSQTNTRRLRAVIPSNPTPKTFIFLIPYLALARVSILLCRVRQPPRTLSSNYSLYKAELHQFIGPRNSGNLGSRLPRLGGEHVGGGLRPGSDVPGERVGVLSLLLNPSDSFFRPRWERAG